MKTVNSYLEGLYARVQGLEQSERCWVGMNPGWDPRMEFVVYRVSEMRRKVNRVDSQLLNWRAFMTTKCATIVQLLLTKSSGKSFLCPLLPPEIAAVATDLGINGGIGTPIAILYSGESLKPHGWLPEGEADSQPCGSFLFALLGK